MRREGAQPPLRGAFSVATPFDGCKQTYGEQGGCGGRVPRRQAAKVGEERRRRGGGGPRTSTLRCSSSTPDSGQCDPSWLVSLLVLRISLLNHLHVVFSVSSLFAVAVVLCPHLLPCSVSVSVRRGGREGHFVCFSDAFFVF